MIFSTGLIGMENLENEIKVGILKLYCSALKLWMNMTYVSSY